MRWVRVVVLLGLLIAPTTARVAGQETPPSSGAASAAPAAPPNAPPTAQERAADEPGGGTAVTLPAPTTAPSLSEDAARPSDDANWVATHQSTDLWSDSDAGRSFGTVRPFTYFQLTGQSADGRLYVYNPRTQNYAWLEAEAVGPVPPPSEAYFKGPQPLAEIDKPGRVVGGFNLRSWPAVRDDTMLRALAHNAPLYIQEAVVGDDGETWYKVGEDEYVHASGVRLP